MYKSSSQQPFGTLTLSLLSNMLAVSLEAWSRLVYLLIYDEAHNEFKVHEVDYPLVPMDQQTSLFRSTMVPIKIFSITAPETQKDPYQV